MNKLKKVLLNFFLIMLALLITVLSVRIPFTFNFETITYLEEAPKSEIYCPQEVDENEDPNMIQLAPKWGECVYAPAGLPFSYTEVQTTKFCSSFSDLKEFVIKDFLVNAFWFLTDALIWWAVLFKIKNVLLAKKK